MQRVVDPRARGRAFRMGDEPDGPGAPQTPLTPGSASFCSFSSSALNRLPRRRKRESVAAMSIMAAAALMKGRKAADGGARKRRRSFMPPSFYDDDTTDFLDASFFGRDSFQEETSSFADDVFETPSESDPQRPDPERGNALTGSALDRTKLERTHLMLPLERGRRKAKDGALPQREAASGPRRRGRRIAAPVQKLFARDKRKYGLGIVGRLTNRTYRQRLDSFVQKQIQDMDDHRPFFSYWITFVHLLVTVLSVSIYGIAPIGFTQHETVDSVLRNKGVYENVKFVQQQNFWVGPSSEALIHLGAKFSPCMRQDEEIQQLIEETKARERQSGCCVRNDRSGCLQTLQEECSNTLAVWVKWPQHASTPFLKGKPWQHGSVCHQDPRICQEPASVSPHEWSDDITQWPICTKLDSGNHTNLPHIDCSITGRPCCIGTKGRCEITSREYCDFMHGYFHEEATLCSQVACMDDVCGLLPFLHPQIPDQFSRLWLSLFLHAGRAVAAASPVSLQRPALPGLRVFPDVGSQGFGEVGWLAPDLHHLPAERRHRKPGLRHLPALQSRGGSRRQPVRHPGLPLRGAFPELADPGAAVASVHQARRHLCLLLLLRSAAVDRQLRPCLRLPVGLLPVLRLPAVHQLRPLQLVQEAAPDLRLPAGFPGSVCRAGRPLLCLPAQMRLVRAPHLRPGHRQVL
ncbi:inactive rhomboid protein 1 isoform X2 [Poeciliopsis prolifica]|uniref:inactive rhomboid protein 1 isoform X2 n=1 Tax=Poeciliopsis prolifica TaxID=188132 RepID=UPI00241409FD|nr:inactive rhomboid protein 1 isoform X2 [Poeciliopsis prolifica]